MSEEGVANRVAVQNTSMVSASSSRVLVNSGIHVVPTTLIDSGLIGCDDSLAPKRGAEDKYGLVCPLFSSTQSPEEEHFTIPRKRYTASQRLH